MKLSTLDKIKEFEKEVKTKEKTTKKIWILNYKRSTSHL